VIRLHLTGGKNYAEHGTPYNAKRSVHIGTLYECAENSMIQG
jgi:hypothetical protein